MHRALPVLAVLSMFAAATAGVAAPAPEPAFAVLSGPFGQSFGYLTRVAVVPVGGQLLLANADVMLHDVVAMDAYGPDDQPWCGLFEEGRCPLFYSELARFGEVVPVHGTEQLQAGSTYTFYCTIHHSMIGTLVAVAEV